MSEAKKQRTTQDIQREYAGLCTKAGDLQYKIAGHKKDRDMVLNAMADLNLEYVKAAEVDAKVQAKFAEQKSQEAAASKPETPASDNVTPTKQEENKAND